MCKTLLTSSLSDNNFLTYPCIFHFIVYCCISCVWQLVIYKYDDDNDDEYFIVTVCISYRFWHIQRQIEAWPWNFGFRSLKVIESDTIRKLGYGFLYAFHSNYGYNLYRLWDKARYWQKIAIFLYPSAFYAPVMGCPCRLERKHHNGMATRTRRWKKFDDTFSGFDRIPACVEQTDGKTDRQMDRRMDGHLVTA